MTALSKSLLSARAVRAPHAPRVAGWCVLVAAAWLSAAAAHAVLIPAGDGAVTVEIEGTPVEVFTYKPRDYRDGPLLFVFHGINRNAEGYRGYARALAERFGMLVAAPRFDRERFPDWRYQSGGVARAAKKTGSGPLALEPQRQWTGYLILKLVDRIRGAAGSPDMPFYLLGHSAGGQALSRFAAFFSSDARRIVIANPSSYVFPDRSMIFPYGFGGLPRELASDAVLRRYLAQPVTIFLGAEDASAKNTDMRPNAMRQGETRYRRGLNAYRAAHALARARGWEFGWRLVEAPGIGHSAPRMFAAAQAEVALFGEKSHK